MPVSYCSTRATQPELGLVVCQLNWYVPGVGVLARKPDLPAATKVRLSVAVFTVSLGQLTAIVPKNTQGAQTEVAQTLRLGGGVVSAQTLPPGVVGPV